MSQSDSFVAPQLVRLGREALDQVGAAIVAGAPLLQCQLLASQFYDALRREFDETPRWDSAKRGRLATVLAQCRRAAAPSVRPEAMLSEFKNAVALLAGESTAGSSPPRRPVLRVIDGGRA